MIKIGSLELGKKPCVAGVVDGILPLDDLVELKQKGLDIIEIRADLIEKPLECIVRYVSDLKALIGLPMIGTVRGNDRTRGNRLKLFSALMPLVDCVDIELGAADATVITELARLQGRTILVSDHNFEKTPGTAELQSIVDRAIAQGGRIVKVVTTAKTEDDAWRLLAFAKQCRVPIVAFAMGAAGSFSRIKAGDYGSLFSYGYIGKAVAPGQLSAGELLTARNAPTRNDRT